MTTTLRDFATLTRVYVRAADLFDRALMDERRQPWARSELRRLQRLGNLRDQLRAKYHAAWSDPSIT